MIVHFVDDRVEIVTQDDHARLAGSILALWRADGLPENPHRDELILATREHDNGWREADAAPRLDPTTGAPVDFRSFPHSERMEIWQRGVGRLAGHPYPAALVAQHAFALHVDRDSEGWAGFRAEMVRLRDQSLSEAGVGSDELAADYGFLALCDTVSLAACGAFEAATLADYRIRAQRDVVRLSPFPLAGSTTFQISYRSLPRASGAEASLAGVPLAEARWRRRPVRLAPLGP